MSPKEKLENLIKLVQKELKLERELWEKNMSNEFFCEGAICAYEVVLSELLGEEI